MDTAIQAEEGLETLLKRIRPDAIVLDNVIMFPAIANAEVPWIRVVSCAETEIPDPNVPALSFRAWRRTIRRARDFEAALSCRDRPGASAL